jgi:predicted PurR-regulated permease PerM
MEHVDGDEAEFALARQAQKSGRPLHSILLFYGIGLLLLVLGGVVWQAAPVLLLVFAAILVAVLLFYLSALLQRWTHLSHPVALTLVIALLAVLAGLTAWLMAPQVARQARELAFALPEVLDRARATLGQYELMRELAAGLPSSGAMMSGASRLLSQAGVFFSGVLGAVANAAVITVVGIYLAAQPGLYMQGLVSLVPQPHRPRANQVLAELGNTLGQWLAGKALTMVIVGAVTAAGLSLIGVPLALVLGIIAGLLDFIPYLGPLIAGVPAVLFALAESPSLVLYVVLLFLGVQIAEGYLLLPLIEQKTVSLPPALLIVAQVLMGALFGLAGVALATPLAAVILVLVSMLYVHDVLGDTDKPPSRQ